MAVSLARDAAAEKSSALGLAAFDTHPTLPHVSIFSLIGFYTNLIYSASDQNENKMKNEAAIRTVSIACSKTPPVESLAADAPSRKHFRRVVFLIGSKDRRPRSLRCGMQLCRHAVFGQRQETEVYFCDADDRLSSVTDPLGRVTSTAYDALSRKVSVSNLAVQANPLVALAYTPDGFDRLSTTTYPDTSTQVFAYDADGNILSRQTRAKLR